MKEMPVEPDIKALKVAFDAQPSHARLRSLKMLHAQGQRLLRRTMREMRKFVEAKTADKVCNNSWEV